MNTQTMNRKEEWTAKSIEGLGLKIHSMLEMKPNLLAIIDASGSMVGYIDRIKQALTSLSFSYNIQVCETPGQVYKPTGHVVPRVYDFGGRDAPKQLTGENWFVTDVVRAFNGPCAWYLASADVIVVFTDMIHRPRELETLVEVVPECKPILWAITGRIPHEVMHLKIGQFMSLQWEGR